MAIFIQVFNALLLLLHETLAYFQMMDRKCKVALCKLIGHATLYAIQRVLGVPRSLTRRFTWCPATWAGLWGRGSHRRSVLGISRRGRSPRSRRRCGRYPPGGMSACAGTG